MGIFTSMCCKDLFNLFGGDPLAHYAGIARLKNVQYHGFRTLAARENHVLPCVPFVSAVTVQYPPECDVGLPAAGKVRNQSDVALPPYIPYCGNFAVLEIEKSKQGMEPLAPCLVLHSEYDPTSGAHLKYFPKRVLAASFYNRLALKVGFENKEVVDWQGG